MRGKRLNQLIDAMHTRITPRVRGNPTTFLCTKSITLSVRNFVLNQHFAFLHTLTKRTILPGKETSIK